MLFRRVRVILSAGNGIQFTLTFPNGRAVNDQLRTGADKGIPTI